MRVTFDRAGQLIEAELALPEGDGPHPGVVLIPDVGGLSELYEEFTARLAAAGLAALALDKYSRGEKPDLSSIETTLKFLHELPDPQVLADVQAALDYLAARPETTDSGLGLMGFCVGGKYSILAACSLSGIRAAVPWYGMLRATELDAANPEHPLDAIPRLSCPLLAIFGEDDALIPQTDVQELRRRAEAAPQSVEVVVYPGAGHAFANPRKPDAYRPDAAEDAWQRTLDFFDRHLRR